ncbi:MAG: HNH endonuclease [Ktedonobacteraceae bacterium]|nr:HNH endonuclease [Ktedonobacteraceae bacterium]
MSHVIPLPRGGTTPENCVPACYSCSTGKGKVHARHRVQAQLVEAGNAGYENLSSGDSDSSPLKR